MLFSKGISFLKKLFFRRDLACPVSTKQKKRFILGGGFFSRKKFDFQGFGRFRKYQRETWKMMAFKNKNIF